MEIKANSNLTVGVACRPIPTDCACGVCGTAPEILENERKIWIEKSLGIKAFSIYADQIDGITYL